MLQRTPPHHFGKDHVITSDEIQTTEVLHRSSSFFFFTQLCPLVVMCTMHSAVRTGSYINRRGTSRFSQSSKPIPAEHFTRQNEDGTYAETSLFIT